MCWGTAVLRCPGPCNLENKILFLSRSTLPCLSSYMAHPSCRWQTPATWAQLHSYHSAPAAWPVGTSGPTLLPGSSETGPWIQVEHWGTKNTQISAALTYGETSKNRVTGPRQRDLGEAAGMIHDAAKYTQDSRSQQQHLIWDIRATTKKSPEQISPLI